MGKVLRFRKKATSCHEKVMQKLEDIGDEMDRIAKKRDDALNAIIERIKKRQEKAESIDGIVEKRRIRAEKRLSLSKLNVVIKRTRKM